MAANNFTGFTEPVMLLTRSPGLFLPDEGMFSRLFPDLAPHQPRVGELEETLRHVYDDDTADRIASGQIDKVPSNPALPAGYTFFAQFVAHDISFDASHFGDRSVDGVLHANMRSPRLDLDHVYGGDPDLNAHFYESDEGGNTYKFRIGKAVGPDGKPSALDDLPRYPNGRAIIPDHREDQHVIISQIHLALMKLHNVMMDRHTPRSSSRREAFIKARMWTRWYYQYVVLTDMLPRMLDPEGKARLEAYSERWKGWQREMIQPPVSPGVPVEFSAGVYRLAHTTIRSAYRVNGTVAPLPLFGRPAGAVPGSAPTSLAGMSPMAASLTVNWHHLLDVNGRRDDVQWARVFSKKLSGTLRLIPGADPINGKDAGLAELDLARALRLGLPSGQAVANRLGLTPRDAGESDPLWYYAMKEVSNGGRAVGPVSAAILTKVFLDLLHLDPGSYRYQQPTWTPGERKFGLASLFKLAGMPFDDRAALTHVTRPGRSGRAPARPADLTSHPTP